MRPLRAHDIHGTWGTLLLPIDEADAIDFDRLRQELDVLVHAGVSGVYSFGSAGELHNVSDEEFDRVNALMAAACEAAGVPFQIGAGHPDPRVGLHRAVRAAALKPGAIQVTLPDWVMPNLDEAGDFLEAVADAVAPIGLVVYNPRHAKRNLSPEALGQLKKRVPNIVGVKVPGGDEDWYRRVRRCMEGLSVFVPGHTLASDMSRGAHGSYSNVACLQPRGAVHWQSLMRHDLDAALAIEQRIKAFLHKRVLPLRHQYHCGDPALDKLLASVGDWAPVGTRLRWPYRGIPDHETSRLQAIARAELAELFGDWDRSHHGVP